MKFNVRDFNKDKSQQDLDKLFKELNGYENPLALKMIKDKNRKIRRK